jgi:hypothetical protein
MTTKETMAPIEIVRRKSRRRPPRTADAPMWVVHGRDGPREAPENVHGREFAKRFRQAAEAGGRKLQRVHLAKPKANRVKAGV